MAGRRRQQRWIYPVLLLSGLAIAGFGAFYTLDRSSSPGAPGGFFAFDPERATEAVASLSGMLAAVLGIIVTVVSIIVQLSAERFAGVTEMFFRDRTNMAVLSFYVLGCMWGIFVGFGVGHAFVPRASVIVMITVALIDFGIMAPYFAYVFDFLQPEQIIERLRKGATEIAERAATTADEERRAEGQATLLHTMSQLTDITINAIDSKDKIIAIAGVDALRELGVRYLELKPRAHASWFSVGHRIAENPDFVSMSAESRTQLEGERTWVEWKILRQYQAIYAEALRGMPDVAYVIAIDTRYLGEAAIARGDGFALELTRKFFNTYLRATLNAKDVRTAYNILNQVRQLGEAMLTAGLDETVVELAGHMKYYGHVSFGMKLGFVTETIAYDLGMLCERADERGSAIEGKLLATFLEVDQAASETETQEKSLRGVRKAQVKLAAYYLSRGQEPKARTIFEDMRHERPERLRSIRDELERVAEKDFWEVIDRGTNFDYLPPDRKALLPTFFSWFDTSQAEPPRV